MLQLNGSSATGFCGLYRFEDNLPVFAILPRNATDQIRFIHDRMPLMILEDLIEDWINPFEKTDEMVKDTLTDMYYEISNSDG